VGPSLILLPFFSVIILNLPLRNLMKRLAFWLCLALLSAQIYWAFFPQAVLWGRYFAVFQEVLRFDLISDSLTRLMLLSIGIVSLVALFMGRRMIENQEQRFNFINLLFIILAGMNGIVMVRDIFSLYVFLEIASIASFIMIASSKHAHALEGVFKYIVMSMVATVLMLSAIALFLVVSGDTSFSAINAAVRGTPSGSMLTFAIGIFSCGLFIKSGLMPFHGWLPDTYSWAPAPVSVLLAGIVTKTVGVYALIRLVVSVFGLHASFQQVLMFVGIISIVIGAIAALGQNDFRRMLAYSSISQVGYIVLGLGSGTALGLSGAVFHLFNHSIFKSLLFVNAAAVETQTGRRDMNTMSGLSKRMPLTGITSCLGSLSCAGIPPLAGFWSKLIIIIALWVSGHYLYAFIAVAASVVTLAYFLSMQRRVFFGKLAEDLVQIKETGFYLGFCAILLALITVGAGIFFPFMLNTFILPVGNILGG